MRIDLTTETRRQGFYWVKDGEGWAPWKWTPKGWTNDWVLVDYTDEEIGEIGPYIPTPDESRDKEISSLTESRNLARRLYEQAEAENSELRAALSTLKEEDAR